MNTSIASRFVLPVLVAGCFVLAGCAGTQPVAYSGLNSATQLKPNPDEDDYRVPYAYSTGANWKAYDQVDVDPVVIYEGNDHQFDSLPQEDKEKLAAYMQTQFEEKLGEHFKLVDQPGPRTLLIKPTLTGVETNTVVLSTFLRFDMAGAVYNGVQSATGGEGALSGSVSYAVEVYDAPSGDLLYAYVEKQYPNAYNVGATLGELDAAKTGIEKGAEDLADRLR